MRIRPAQLVDLERLMVLTHAAFGDSAWSHGLMRDILEAARQRPWLQVVRVLEMSPRELADILLASQAELAQRAGLRMPSSASSPDFAQPPDSAPPPSSPPSMAPTSLPSSPPKTSSSASSSSSASPSPSSALRSPSAVPTPPSASSAGTYASSGAEYIAGYLVLQVVGADAEIQSLAVDPHLQRRGLGGMLLDDSLALAANRRLERVFLEVRAGNLAAQQFYLHHGFESFGRRARYYHSPVEDALLMRRRVMESKL